MGASVRTCTSVISEGHGVYADWDPASFRPDAIRDACPGVLLNFSTGVMGPDISGPVACLERCKPETAAMNAGSLNYLKVRRNGTWAWPPLLFDNSVDKIEKFLNVMYEQGIAPECECFDTGIVRTRMLKQVGLLRDPVHVSLVMGVARGCPRKHPGCPCWSMSYPKTPIGRRLLLDARKSGNCIARPLKWAGISGPVSKTRSICLTERRRPAMAN